MAGRGGAGRVCKQKRCPATDSPTRRLIDPFAFSSPIPFPLPSPTTRSYEKLDKLTERLINGILKEARAAGHAVCGGHISGMFGFFFTEGPVKCFKDAAKSDTVRPSSLRPFPSSRSPP